MDAWLLDLPDQDITSAVDAIFDSKVRYEMMLSRPDLMPIWENPSTQSQALHLVSCQLDRAWAQLAWVDERDCA